ncbi:hypothetical protein JCGZ_01309 [Jatropha curcas]|uniref:Uncharacterized protein n=1 Tax=Jatropha curcas TaxID=180498 RepID=A0A067LKG4_JATCU|nr:hypothetical protein JCGZ_01309 [Jatropha curcas]
MANRSNPHLTGPPIVFPFSLFFSIPTGGNPVVYPYHIIRCTRGANLHTANGLVDRPHKPMREKEIILSVRASPECLQPITRSPPPAAVHGGRKIVPLLDLSGAYTPRLENSPEIRIHVSFVHLVSRSVGIKLDSRSTTAFNGTSAIRAPSLKLIEGKYFQGPITPLELRSRERRLEIQSVAQGESSTTSCSSCGGRNCSPSREEEAVERAEEEEEEERKKKKRN